MSFKAMSKEDRAKFKAEADQRWSARIEGYLTSVRTHYQSFFKAIPTRYQRTWLDCWDGTASKRKAIAAKCYDCVGYEDTQKNVGECPAKTCPLWNYRPLQKSNIGNCAKK